MRQQRQLAIHRILRASAVSTQGQIIAALAKRGLEVDQSTLSRDLKELGVRKFAGQYVIPSEEASDPPEVDYSAAVLSFVACGPHLIVMRTAIGQAQPIALAIDGRADPSIAGTLAGDDTIFVAVHSSKDGQRVARNLRRLM